MCVCSLLCKDVCATVSLLNRWEVRPASKSWPLTLITLTSSSKPKCLLQTCARGLPAPKALHFGPPSV